MNKEKIKELYGYIGLQLLEEEFNDEEINAIEDMNKVMRVLYKYAPPHILGFEFETIEYTIDFEAEDYTEIR